MAGEKNGPSRRLSVLGQTERRRFDVVTESACSDDIRISPEASSLKHGEEYVNTLRGK